METETPFVPSSYCQQQTGGRSKKDRTERALGGTACFVLGEVTRPSTVCRARHPLPPQPPARAALSASLPQGGGAAPPPAWPRAPVAPKGGALVRGQACGVDCTATIARGADRTPAARLSPCPRARTNGSSHPGYRASPCRPTRREGFSVDCSVLFTPAGELLPRCLSASTTYFIFIFKTSVPKIHRFSHIFFFREIFP